MVLREVEEKSQNLRSQRGRRIVPCRSATVREPLPNRTASSRPSARSSACSAISGFDFSYSRPLCKSALRISLLFLRENSASPRLRVELNASLLTNCICYCMRWPCTPGGRFGGCSRLKPAQRGGAETRSSGFGLRRKLRSLPKLTPRARSSACSAISGFDFSYSRPLCKSALRISLLLLRETPRLRVSALSCFGVTSTKANL